MLKMVAPLSRHGFRASRAPRQSNPIQSDSTHCLFSTTVQGRFSPVPSCNGSHHPDFPEPALRRLPSLGALGLCKDSSPETEPAWNQASGTRHAKHIQASSGLRTGRALATPGGLLYPGRGYRLPLAATMAGTWRDPCVDVTTGPQLAEGQRCPRPTGDSGPGRGLSRWAGRI